MLVLDALGIGAGDEVICPAFTFYATAEAIARIGATPVFADIEPGSLNIDPNDVERKITPKTKAIMPVHLFGRPAAVDELRRFDLPIIEDAAQAFGSPGIATSIASTFSFFPTKNLFALGDGGLISVNDAELADRIRMLRFHGSKAKKDFELIGYNSRLDALQAAMLQDLPAAARRLERSPPRGRGPLRGARPRPRSRSCRADEPGHVYHMYCVRSFERDRLAAALAEAEIGFASYYLPPLHLQPALRYLGYSEGDLPGDREGVAREPLPADVGRDQRGAAGRGRRRPEERIESRQDVISFPLNRHRLGQVVLDGALIAAAWWLAFFLTFDQTVPRYYRHFMSWQIFALVVAIGLVAFALSGFYNRWWRYTSTHDMWGAAARRHHRLCRLDARPLRLPAGEHLAPAEADRCARLPASPRVRHRHPAARAVARRAARRRDRGARQGSARRRRR